MDELIELDWHGLDTRSQGKLAPPKDILHSLNNVREHSRFALSGTKKANKAEWVRLATIMTTTSIKHRAHWPLPKQWHFGCRACFDVDHKARAVAIVAAHVGTVCPN